VFVILLAYPVAAVLVALAARRLGTRSLLLAAAVPALTFGWALAVAPGVIDGDPRTESASWVPSLGLSFPLRLDAFALLFVLIITGIGMAVFAYARWYLHDGPGIGRLAGLLVFFAGSMIGLVLADNLLALFVFWELTSVASFLLIGIDDEKAAARAAAMQAFLTTGAGSLAMLAGLAVLGQQAGTYTLSEILAAPPSGTATDIAVVLVLAGVITKSAQVPFHYWLPGAMAAPTPVSAYLHSATMVKAGVYVVARFSPAFAEGTPWGPLVVAFGAATLVLGAYRALRQHDLKLLLAFGTVSQLGLMVLLFGIGTPEAVLAGCALVLAHALFKAALFLVVGTVDHQAGTRDLRRLGGLGRRLPVLAGAAAVAAASMAGLPPLFGFVAKEAGLAALLEAPLAAAGVAVLAGTVVVGSAGTLAYAFRFVWGGFGPHEHHVGGFPGDRRIDPDEVSAPGPGLLVPSVVLAGLGVVFGLVPALPAVLLDPAAAALAPPGSEEHLALWHGLTGALGLSVVAIGLGAGLAVARRRVERLQANAPHPPSGSDAYQASVRGLLTGADQVTGAVQRGSLPFYLAVILASAVLAPGVPLAVGFARGDIPAPTALAEGPIQIVVVALLVVTALAVCLARRRVIAVILVGVVGYATAGLFVIQGAPDLAITQLLVETLGVVVFLFVLRHLPGRFPSGVRTAPNRRAARRVVVGRIALAVAVGSLVTVFALSASQQRSESPMAEAFVERAAPDGGGDNIVNVVLVDFRGFDTMGEITVLVVVALGVAALVQAARRSASSPEQDEPPVLEVDAP
jgi:multicomponent Na+:H+ antiporter subunit A